MTRRHPPVAQARARRAEEDGLPSVGVFLLAPALGLCFWVGLALLIF